MFSLLRNDLDSLTLATIDWSQLNSPDAPTREQITNDYSVRFQAEVSSARYAIHGVPQLELRVPINDIDDASKAIEGMFQGNPLQEHDETWRALHSRLSPVLDAHLKLNPAFCFSPAAAAVAAYRTMRFTIHGEPPVFMDGYRHLSLEELRGGRLNPTVSVGRTPKSEVREGGHLFRKNFDDSKSTTEPKRIADLVLVDTFGVHRTYLYEGSAPHISELTGIILYAPNPPKNPPTFFRKRPAAKPLPPVSHCMTFGARLEEQDRIRMESALDRRMDPLENGMDGIHVDLSDIPNWPDLRAKLFAGENIADERQAYNAIATRLRWLFHSPGGTIYFPVDAAAVLALAVIQDGSTDAMRRDISMRRTAGNVYPVLHSGITELRLGGIGVAESWALEKRPDLIPWPRDNTPYDLPEKHVLRDEGFALSFYVNGTLNSVMVEP